jgi:hypothetical protein
MQTLQIQVYNYSELDDYAQTRAREWFFNNNDYPWYDDALNSLNGFCKEFGVKVTDYCLGDTYDARIKTDMSSASFRGFTKKDAIQLKDKEISGYCMDWSLTDGFYQSFIKHGDAKQAFLDALDCLLTDIKKDIEYHYSEEYMLEMFEINDYQFDQHGRFM